MVGDSFTDMEAGFRAGCGCCIFVTEGGNSRNDFVAWLKRYFKLDLTMNENNYRNSISVYRIFLTTSSASNDPREMNSTENIDNIDFVVLDNIDQMLRLFK